MKTTILLLEKVAYSDNLTVLFLTRKEYDNFLRKFYQRNNIVCLQIDKKGVEYLIEKQITFDSIDLFVQRIQYRYSRNSVKIIHDTRC